MELIGEKIRRVRKSKGISQTTVSNTCGIKQSSYANIENGKTQNITIEIGKGIAKALDIPFNELFDIEISPDIESQNNNIEELDNLWKILKEKNKALEERSLLIDLLVKEREFYKQTSVSAIVSYYDRTIEQIENDIKIAKSDADRAYLEVFKRNQLDVKQHMINQFINIGFFDQKDIDNYYKELSEHFGTLGKIWKRNYDSGEDQYLIEPETGELTPKE